MSGHRSFGTSESEAILEPLSFDIAGEDFKILRPLPALPMLRMARYEGVKDLSLPQAMALFDEFMEAALGDDYERFASATIRARIGVETFVDIISWCMEELTGRPLELPAPSVPGPSATLPGPSGAGIASIGIASPLKLTAVEYLNLASWWLVTNFNLDEEDRALIIGGAEQVKRNQAVKRTQQLRQMGGEIH